jgi:hypothetical protein
MDEVEHPRRLQLLAAEPERSLPRRIEPYEVTAEVRDGEHVNRQIEKPCVHTGRVHCHIVLDAPFPAPSQRPNCRKW